jgi:hypothetical protein
MYHDADKNVSQTQVMAHIQTDAEKYFDEKYNNMERLHTRKANQFTLAEIKKQKDKLRFA